MREKILVTPRSFGKNDPSLFTSLEDAGFEVVRNETGGVMKADQLREALADCVGLIVGVDPVGADAIAGAKKLRAIAKYGVGTDNIDLESCKARGIPVSVASGANAQAVADYAFALMLAAARQVALVDARCRNADWSKTLGRDVFGATLGLIGFGAIGRGMASRAKGFQMRVLAFDPYFDESAAAALGVERADLETIYREADFISLHAPLTEENRNLIGESALSQMRESAVLINTARGGLVDEDALLRALQAKRIFAAGIDAFSKEPPENPAWYALDNVVLGSHNAASSIGANNAMGKMAVENVLRELAR